jgi:hypothetical protein
VLQIIGSSTCDWGFFAGKMRLLFGGLWYLSVVTAFRDVPACWGARFSSSSARSGMQSGSSVCGLSPPVIRKPSHDKFRGAGAARSGLWRPLAAVRGGGDAAAHVAGSDGAGSAPPSAEHERLSTLRAQDDEVWSIVRDERRRQVRYHQNTPLWFCG